MNQEPKTFPKKSAELYPGTFAYADPDSPIEDKGGYSDPNIPIEDQRPDFVKADEEGWEKLSPPPDH